VRVHIIDLKGSNDVGSLRQMAQASAERSAKALTVFSIRLVLLAHRVLEQTSKTYFL
jgi:hypothetical protein